MKKNKGNKMEPIAIYSETRFSGKRDFKLYPDEIRVIGKVFLQKDFDVNIELKNLNPNYEKVKIREKGFMAGMYLIILPLIIKFILISAFNVKIDNPAIGFMVILAISGGILCIATFRKIEFYVFKNSFGVNILDIARSGKEKHNFDKYVEQIILCVNECNSNINTGKIE
jgi:hypothetical protein